MTDITDITSIDKKWQEKWEKEGAYYADPKREGGTKKEEKERKQNEPGTEQKKKKKYITAAFPYPNSPQHIGHARTYTTTDIYARYWRLRGYNVLFPMAFHVTGTPILAMAKRIAEKDEEVLGVFERIYGISRTTAATLTEPNALVMHFSKEIEAGMREIGYSIDWRRKFYSFDKKFNRFIEWQFAKLKAQGLIVQGEHAIPWCPRDGNAVGAHDTRGDVDPELKEYTAIKFAYKDGYILTATLRPETIYGVTNIWVNPDIIHIKARNKAGGDIYYVSKKAYERMKSQGFELEILEEVLGEELINGKVKNLVTGDDVPIYAANYVKDDTGTGIVMSVPSHAPYDHIALLDMGIRLDYTEIIRVEGYKFMAKELIEQRGIKNQNDPRLEEIVKEVYKKEILTGVMLAGPYKGEPVSAAIQKTIKDMLAKKQAVPLWEIGNKPVHCRCGAEIIANVVKDQWFIDYGNEEWKKKARECIDAMSIIPEKNRADYLYTAGWLREKACARAAGLGTRLPFDKSKMIEALSDSTIYMAFYTIAHLLESEGIDESELTEEFFDYVFYGKEQKAGRGTGNARLKTQDSKLKKLRESFLYWYPLDSRHSGADLVRNHLPFFIFNHVAIFPREHWPRQIVTNGFVMMNGAKMSKSMGNILPLRKALMEYGADIIRFSVVSGADITQDTDFNKTVAEGTRSRLDYIGRLIAETSGCDNQGKESGTKKSKSERSGSAKKSASAIDMWLFSRLNRKIKLASELYEKLALRELALEIFYGIYDDLKWYAKRTGANTAGTPALSDFFKKWVVLISPFMPHHAEEFWQMLGGKTSGFVANAAFPKADEKAISDDAEKGEELVRKVIEDVENLEKILNKKPTEVRIFVANDAKRKIYKIIASEKAFDKIMKAASQDPELKTKMDVVQRMAKSLMKSAYSLPPVLPAKEELAVLKEAESFFSKEFKCPVSVMDEDDATTGTPGMERAKNAMPGKPGIGIE